MLILALYILVIIVALIWVRLDWDPTSAFEFFRKDLHTLAREMGVYREWLVHSLGRFVFFSTLALVNIAAASWVLRENPWDLGQPTRISMFGVMIGGALALFAFPYVFARLRFVRCLYSKSAELSGLVSIIGSESEVQHRLEPAKYDTTDGWTAWHPRGNEWKDNRLWAGLVPVAYFRQEPELSVIVPIDWEHFLAWKLPAKDLPGNRLPFHGPDNTTFLVTSIHRICGRQGWSVVRADIDGLQA